MKILLNKTSTSQKASKAWEMQGNIPEREVREVMFAVIFSQGAFGHLEPK